MIPVPWNPNLSLPPPIACRSPNQQVPFCVAPLSTLTPSRPPRLCSGGHGLQVAKGSRPPDTGWCDPPRFSPNQSPRSKPALLQPLASPGLSPRALLPSEAHLLLYRRPGRRLTPAKPANRAARPRLRPFPAGAAPSRKESPTSPRAAAHLLSQAMPRGPARPRSWEWRPGQDRGGGAPLSASSGGPGAEVGGAPRAGGGRGQAGRGPSREGGLRGLLGDGVGRGREGCGAPRAVQGPPPPSQLPPAPGHVHADPRRRPWWKGFLPSAAASEEQQELALFGFPLMREGKERDQQRQAVSLCNSKPRGREPEEITRRAAAHAPRSLAVRAARMNGCVVAPRVWL